MVEPLPYFDSLLAFRTFHPVRLDVIEANPDSYTRPGIMVSNGEYILAEHNVGESFIWEKNPLYWDAENVAFERIEVPIISEPATCLVAFEAGEIDVTGCGVPPQELARFLQMPEFVRVPEPGGYISGIQHPCATHT